MPNWISVDVTLSGPQSEIERFRNTCIRQLTGANDGEIGFDFESLIPMPDHVRNSLADSDAAPRSRDEPFRMPLWWEWRVKNWGVKWNAGQFVEHEAAPDRIVFEFEVPWSVPLPVFSALAEQFPLLSGDVSAVGWADNWIARGFVSDGAFSAVTTDITRETLFLAETTLCPTIREATVHAQRELMVQQGTTPGSSAASLLEVADDNFWRHASAVLEREPLLALRAAYEIECCVDRTSWSEVSGDEFWKRLCAHLRPDLVRRLNFAFDADRFCDWHDEDGLWFEKEEEAGSVDEVIRSPENLKFIESNGRTFYRVDRKLMALLARHFKANLDTSKTDRELDQEFRLDVAHMLVNVSEDDLWEWAAHAIFRSTQLILADLGTLQTSFVTYASRLRHETVRFLAGDDDRNSIAA